MTAVPFLFLAVSRSVARLALIGSLTQSRVPGKEKPPLRKGLWRLSWLLMDVGGPNPPWYALFPRQVVLHCRRQPTEHNPESEPEGSSIGFLGCGWVPRSGVGLRGRASRPALLPALISSPDFRRQWAVTLSFPKLLWVRAHAHRTERTPEQNVGSTPCPWARHTISVLYNICHLRGRKLSLPFL